ncbi:intraflagellar transport protein 56 isoform X2 [Diprion similis]|uniref:intraflagellar transport protein 56 isoform X2 n=1 Tax=Diprion similis TaxID=362088 RepID=UPI001EF8374F|nr:intraflagellar transport protein 56 isoform X2 [Diprion similis]
MILSRAKPVVTDGTKKSASRKEIPKLEEFLEKRDYTGALTLLEYNGNEKNSINTDLWIGYCAFHLGDYKRAAKVYENMRKKGNTSVDLATNLACCYFYLGMYPEALNVVEESPDSRLKIRILFHLSHKMGDEKKLMEYHQMLEDVIEDQLCLASIHYLRAHYQEAIDIYKRILLENRLYNGSAAQAEMKQLMEQTSSSFSFGHDLIRHNIVVFRGGEGALQVLPSLVDVIPEARLNLVIYYLKQNEVREAFELIKDLEPAVPQEYILKGVVNAAIGQETGSRENIKTAQQYFQLVGSSVSECDTIPGRQCMASCFFLFRQFEEVLVYLHSIKSYYFNEDVFNFNYGQAKTAAGYFKEAEDAFLMIRNERYKNDYVYISLLSYCYIMNKKAQLAWELYLKMETSNESFNLLQLIANTCYKVGEFWHAAKAFDMLERMDPSPEHWEGKRGACCGTFQYIVAGKQPKELLPDVIQLLRNTNNSQVEQISRVMRKWGKDNRINF